MEPQDLDIGAGLHLRPVAGEDVGPRGVGLGPAQTQHRSLCRIDLHAFGFCFPDRAPECILALYNMFITVVSTSVLTPLCCFHIHCIHLKIVICLLYTSPSPRD